MAVSARQYGNLVLKAFRKEVHLETDTIKVALLTSAYVPDQDAHDYFNDLTNEVSGTGYTAGGLTLTGKTVTYNAATNLFTFDGNDLSWPGSTLTARYAVVYDAQTGVASTMPLIGLVDFGENISSVNGPFTVTWDPTGILTFTIAA